MRPSTSSERKVSCATTSPPTRGWAPPPRPPWPAPGSLWSPPPVVAVVALDAVESQCVCADVCTGGHRLTREFVVGVVAAVEICLRVCIM